MEKPFLSVVITARNDDYGGNLINRIKTSLRTLEYLAEKHALSIELILVEYNPVKGKIPLWKELFPLEKNILTVKTIVVPESYHQQFKTRIPLLEYIAKNIGIRRAQGQYILVMNPDIILSDEIVAFIASGTLQEETFYRADRYDLSVPYFEETLTPEQILSISKKSVSKILFRKSTVYLSLAEWFPAFIHTRTLRSFMICPLFNFYTRKKVEQDQTSIHEVAAGDFLLMHRNAWEKIGGYDETPLSSYMDSYILHVATCHDYTQYVIPFPIFHINHKIGKAGRPEVSREKYLSDVRKMSETKIPYLQRSNYWGHPETHFEEITF